MKKTISTIFLCLLLSNQPSIAKTGKKIIQKKDPNISLIKNGVLGFDNSITLGMAIDNYKYCNQVKWDSFKSDNGRNLVSAECDYKIYNKSDIENIYKNLGITENEKNIYQEKKRIAIEQRAWDKLNLNYFGFPIVRATIGEKVKPEEYPEKVLKQTVIFTFVINYDHTFKFYSYGVINLIEDKNKKIEERPTDLGISLEEQISNLYKNERLW